MISRIIKNQHEIVEFAKMYEKLSKNVKADINYLLKAKVRAFFEDGRMVGGYAVSTVDKNNDLRYLTFLSVEQRQGLLEKGLNPQDYAEITYIFVENKRVCFLNNVRIMLHSLWDAFLQFKKNIMGGGVIERFNERMKVVLQNTRFDDLVFVSKDSGEMKKFKILTENSLKTILIMIPKAFVLEAIKFVRKRSQ